MTYLGFLLFFHYFVESQLLAGLDSEVWWTFLLLILKLGTIVRLIILFYLLPSYWLIQFTTLIYLITALHLLPESTLILFVFQRLLHFLLEHRILIAVNKINQGVIMWVLDLLDFFDVLEVVFEHWQRLLFIMMCILIASIHNLLNTFKCPRRCAICFSLEILLPLTVSHHATTRRLISARLNHQIKHLFWLEGLFRLPRNLLRIIGRLHGAHGVNEAQVVQGTASFGLFSFSVGFHGAGD